MSNNQPVQQTIYLVPWRNHRDGITGDCLSLDGQERDGGYVETLCEHTVTLPAGIEVWDGIVDEWLCADCGGVAMDLLE